MDDEIKSELKISKNAQKFVTDLSNLPKEKYLKVKDLLIVLGKQNDAEANLENKRGWRYMWQRTPKPFLVMMGYFVGFGSIGSFGYANYSKAVGFEQLYLYSLMSIMIAPLILVGILTYFYIKNENNNERVNSSK